MSSKILLVDDEVNLLEGLKRQLRKQFDVSIADGPLTGLETIKNHGPFAVVVSDLRMPVMDGIQFLSEVRKIAPDSVRVMLTGNADLDAAMDAVNEGNVFRFLTKPCPPETLTKVLNTSISQYQLITAEKELIEKTLSGSVKILIEMLSLLSPIAFGRASRLRRIMADLAEKMNVKNRWEFELAGMLSQIGCVTIPKETIENIYSGKLVSAAETEMFKKHPQVGASLISNIPRLIGVSKIILYQNKHFNGDGFPEDDIKGENIPAGARALHVAIEYDTLVQSGKKDALAYNELRKQIGRFDPEIIKLMGDKVAEDEGLEAKQVQVYELVSGMILDENVITTTGLLVISKGQEITPALKSRLENFSVTVGVREPIRVLVPLQKVTV